ncbi:MAG: restriction endonuclease [Candidatus Peribacteraceae bacterium]
MPTPPYNELLLPLLQFLQDANDHSLKEAIAYLEDRFKLTEEERSQLLPSGRQRVIANRTSWAGFYLKHAEFIDSPRRGYMRIAKRGLDFLAGKPRVLTVDDLRQYPEFLEFIKGSDRGGEKKQEKRIVNSMQELTPEERIRFANEEIEGDLAQSLLEQIGSLPPAFFERLVVDLLLKMGYGGSFKDAGRAIGKSGDGGIDGIIKEDKLGLDTIYIQAKRWEGTVGRPEIHKFVGALAGVRAKKGVFITTSSFSVDALSYAASLDSKIVLIDGRQLAELMIEHDIGVASLATYTVKRLDTDYFSEE